MLLKEETFEAGKSQTFHVPTIEIWEKLSALCDVQQPTQAEKCSNEHPKTA